MRKNYCVLVKYSTFEWANVCNDLSICYWGDKKNYIFDSLEKAQEIMKKYIEKNPDTNYYRIKIEENTEEEL